MQGAVLAIFDESKGAVSLGQLSAFFEEIVCGETVPVNWHSSRPESIPHLRSSSFLSDLDRSHGKTGWAVAFCLRTAEDACFSFWFLS